jgi:hypothetical protein
VNDRNIAEKLVVCTKRSQVDAKKYIFYQLTNSTPHFLQRGILEIFSAVF